MVMESLPMAEVLAEVSVVAVAEAAVDSDFGGKFKLSK
jgi:hypothetical protein